MRLYASTYPAEVVGLVLVDAFSEELPGQLTPAQWTVYLGLDRAIPPALAPYRELETMDFEASLAQLRRATAARPLRPLPAAVLARGRAEALPAETEAVLPVAVFERAWRTSLEALARRPPPARFILAAESGHYVQLEQPELVIAAVREVVEAARRAPAAAVGGLPRTGTGPAQR